MRHRTVLSAAVLAAAFIVYSPPAHADGGTVATVGTSITAGTWLQPGQSWPSRLAPRAPGWTIADYSLPGGAYTRNSANGDNIRRHVDQAIATHPDTLILDGPVNDLVGLDLSQIGDLDWAVYGAAEAAYAAGVKHVIVMSILPFNDGQVFPAGWWPTLEQRREAYNQWAHDMWGTGNVDVSWALTETGGLRADNRWYLDGLHPNRVGADLLAEVFPVERLGGA